MTRALLDAIEEEPRLKLVATGTLRIHAAGRCAQNTPGQRGCELLPYHGRLARARSKNASLRELF